MPKVKKRTAPRKKLASKRKPGRELSALIGEHRDLSQILEGIGQGYALWDERVKLIFNNKNFKALFGKDSGILEDTPGRSTVAKALNKRIVSPSNRKVGELFRAVRSTKINLSANVEYQMMDGKWIVLESVEVSNGLAVTTVYDISPIKEQQLSSERDA